MGSHFDIGYFKKPVKIRAKVAKERTVINKMYAWELGKEYYDGNRLNGYGGFKYDGRWQKLLPKIIKKYKLTKKSKVLDLGCKKGFLLKVIFHCFTGSTKLRSFCLDNEFYISISGIITFKNANDLREVISDFPLQQMLIETDSPFLAPIPFRGKMNEPSYVKYISEYLSKFYNISQKEFNEITDNNFYKLFSKAIRYNEIS